MATNYTLLIEKDGPNKFRHTHNGLALSKFSISDYECSIDGNLFKIVEKDGASRYAYQIENIIIKDNTNGGVQFEFLDPILFENKLRALGYTPYLTNGTTGGISSVVAGTGVTVDNTDPLNPVVNASGGGPQNLQQVLTAGSTAIDLGANFTNTLDDTLLQIDGYGANIFIENPSTLNASVQNVDGFVVGNSGIGKFIRVLKDRITRSVATFNTDLLFTDPTANRAITFKDESGTVAFLSDITGGAQGKVALSDETGSAFTDLATALAWMATQTGATITNGSFDSGVFRFDVPSGSSVGDNFLAGLPNVQFEDKYFLFTTFGDSCLNGNTRNNIISYLTAASNFLQGATGSNTIKKLVSIGNNFANSASGRLFIESFGPGLPTDIISTANNLVVVTPYVNKFIDAGSPDPAIATILANISGNAKFVYEDLGEGLNPSTDFYIGDPAGSNIHFKSDGDIDLNPGNTATLFGGYLLTSTQGVIQGVDNTTTLALTSAQLNTAYGAVTTGFKVYCTGIIAGKMTYEKTPSGWIGYTVLIP